jgi:hypothetical protein
MGNKNRIWPEWYRVIQGRDLLFPDNQYKFSVIPEGLWKNVQKRAQELLKERPTAPDHEKAHWKSIVNGEVPYGLQVESRGKK